MIKCFVALLVIGFGYPEWAAAQTQNPPHPHTVSSCAPPARASSVRHAIAMGLAMDEEIPLEEALERTPTPHPCHCAGMVSEVQQHYYERYEQERRSCWERFAPGLPPLGPDSFGARLFVPPGVKTCIEQIGWGVPDHCTVIAFGTSVWARKGVVGLAPSPHGGSYNACGTSCNPERCLCPDRVCQPHDWADDPYYRNLEELPDTEE